MPIVVDLQLRLFVTTVNVACQQITDMVMLGEGDMPAFVEYEAVVIPKRPCMSSVIGVAVKTDEWNSRVTQRVPRAESRHSCAEHCYWSHPENPRVEARRRPDFGPHQLPIPSSRAPRSLIIASPLARFRALTTSPTRRRARI